MMIPKNKPIRNKAHLEFIRGLSCCVCGRFPCDAAHVRSGTGGGMGIKPGDNFTIPMCRPCHQKQHYVGEKNFHGGSTERVIELANALWVMTGQKEQAAERIARFRKCTS
jgi:hypothetical protein